MSEQRLKPTVIVPDTSPLVHLAAANALSVLNGFGRVVVIDVVALEATNDVDKPYAADIAAWIEAGQKPGSNQPVEIGVTELGPLYRMALDQNVKPPRNAGEIAMTEWLAYAVRQTGGPALVVYENGRVPAMLAREGIAATIAVATTRNLLALAQREGIIPDAEAVWSRIVSAVPTANPPAIRRYASGEISASNAAELLGNKATVADVFVMTRRLPLPRPSHAQEQAELAHAIKILGLR